MTAERNLIGFPAVNTQTGQNVRDRRLAIGMSVRELAEHAKVDRGSLAALEAGEPVRETTLAKVLNALDALEQEMGMETAEVEVQPIGDPSLGLLEIRVKGRGGFSAVVRGPVDNPAAVAAAARELMGEMSTPPEDNNQGD